MNSMHPLRTNRRIIAKAACMIGLFAVAACDWPFEPCGSNDRLDPAFRVQVRQAGNEQPIASGTTLTVFRGGHEVERYTFPNDPSRDNNEFVSSLEDAGEYQIQASRPGYTTVMQSFTVRPGRCNAVQELVVLRLALER
jgi:hypothetical protein